MIKGVLLDIDGTLVLSNDAHAAAWVDAFAESGYDVSFDAVRKLIGMGGDKLLSEVEPSLNEKTGDGKKIKEARTRIFLEKYVGQLKPTPGSRLLVESLQQNGLRTMVASSAKQDELEALLKAAQVQDLLTEATTSDDADKSKPDPDIVLVALDKIGLRPHEVIMVGDTPYDIEAAAKAGVACIAVRSGGWKDEQLNDALGVYQDPQDLVRNQEEIITVVQQYVERVSA